MYPLMNTAPVTDMNRRPNQVLQMLNDGPVALLARSEPAAVMIAPKVWNKLAAQLEEQADVIDALIAKLALATGEVKAASADIAMLERMAGRVRA